MTTSLAAIRRQITACDRCPRLRTHCVRVAQEKRAAYRDQPYWGRPVPGFGDRRARVLVLGLAPAAHGANRTGRVFTGDGSADFLMRAMHGAGFANLATSRARGDGLALTDAYIAAVVRCAPPGNRPTPAEIANCRPHLDAELRALADLRVIVALGKVAFDACWRIAAGPARRPRPRFAHGLVIEAAGACSLVASYHPSRHNTNTGRLTPAMLAAVFETARRLASS